MKAIESIIIAALIANIICNCDSTTDIYQNGEYNVDNCNKINKGDGYCCYVEAPQSSDKKFCESYSEYEYKHIGVIVKYNKVFGGDDQDKKDDDFKIDCKSFFLQISSFMLFLLFI